jgi:hypothetical protein
LTASVVFAVSLLAALLAVALWRERRLRLALQALVVKLFRYWRNPHERDSPSRSDDVHTRPVDRERM